MPDRRDTSAKVARLENLFVALEITDNHISRQKPRFLCSVH